MSSSDSPASPADPAANTPAAEALDAGTPTTLQRAPNVAALAERIDRLEAGVSAKFDALLAAVQQLRHDQQQHAEHTRNVHQQSPVVRPRPIGVSPSPATWEVPERSPTYATERRGSLAHRMSASSVLDNLAPMPDSAARLPLSHQHPSQHQSQHSGKRSPSHPPSRGESPARGKPHKFADVAVPPISGSLLSDTVQQQPSVASDTGPLAHGDGPGRRVPGIGVVRRVPNASQVDQTGTLSRHGSGHSTASAAAPSRVVKRHESAHKPGLRVVAGRKPELAPRARWSAALAAVRDDAARRAAPDAGVSADGGFDTLIGASQKPSDVVARSPKNSPGRESKDAEFYNATNNDDGSTRDAAEAVNAARSSESPPATADSNDDARDNAGAASAAMFASRRGQADPEATSWRERLSNVPGVSPTHPAITALDVLYIVTALLAAAVALQRTALGDHAPASTAAARAILLCCHAFMLVWTATRFFVHTCDGWDVCATAGAIAKVYARGWLRFDAAVALPLDWPLAWAYPPAFFGLQLRHVLRFARFPSLAHSGNPLASSRMSFRLMSQLAIVLFVVHLCAVVYAVVESSSYLSGLYWAVSTTTSVSYGDILPGKTGGSRVLACSAMVAGVAMVAALTAGFTAALTRQDARMQAEDDRKQLLASMLAYYEVPWDEQMELIAMFPAVLDAENRRSFKGLLENLPGFMVEKIEGFAMAKAVTESIPLFRDCERGALSDLTQRLVHRFYRPNEVIVQAGAEGFEMYFLVRGTADVLANLPTGVTAVVATLRNGAFFGEVALVTESCVRTASVVAVTPAEVLVLDKQAYLELVAAHASIGRVFDIVTEQARLRAAATHRNRANSIAAAGNPLAVSTIFSDDDSNDDGNATASHTPQVEGIDTTVEGIEQQFRLPHATPSGASSSSDAVLVPTEQPAEAALAPVMHSSDDALASAAGDAALLT